MYIHICTIYILPSIYVMCKVFLFFFLFLRTHCCCDKIISQSGINKVILFYSILFYSILFYSILFYCLGCQPHYPLSTRGRQRESVNRQNYRGGIGQMEETDQIGKGHMITRREWNEFKWGWKEWAASGDKENTSDTHWSKHIKY